jgi:tRNA modification GTPase
LVMPCDLHDTIVARASADGPGMRGIVRISGPDALAVAQRLTSVASFAAQPVAHDAWLNLRLAERDTRLPAMLCVWPGARSFTRQPVVEIHTIGAPAIIEAIVAAAVEVGARLAEPGEFTLRALLAGRIDLTQAEAVLATIDATSESALRTALAQLAGGMAEPLAALRSDLISLVADIEAGLDFVDEDIEFVAAAVVAQRLESAEQQAAALRSQLADRNLRDELPWVVLTGPPNAGKSSLFNALVDRFAEDGRLSRAIVSATPGATRDALLVTLSIAGTRCVLCDTAGIDEQLAGTHSPGGAAQHMAHLTLGQAAVRVECCSAEGGLTWTDHAGVLRVLTKVDLLAHGEASGALATSVATGEGIDRLARLVAAEVDAGSFEASATVVPHTAARCATSLAAAGESLARAHHLATTASGDELVSAEIRVALEHLGSVAGTVSTDDVLDQVFSRFCIGK